jgi:Helicase conserved C-terminal domain
VGAGSAGCVLAKAAQRYGPQVQIVAGIQQIGGRVGMLLGPFDLVIVDEAHKSREDIEGSRESRSNVRKRLNLLLEDIIRQTTHSRRIGLTATPIQLDVEDWRYTLQRIHATNINGRMRKIQAFEDMRQQLRPGIASEKELTQFCDAAGEFHEALKHVMVRRRWRDQQIMIKARERIKEIEGIEAGGAHPHRRWCDKEIAWASLSSTHKRAFLAAEGRTAAAIGTELGLKEKTVGLRHAQGLDIFDSLGSGKNEREEDENDALLSVESAERLRRERRNAFWRKVQHNLLEAAAPRDTNPLLSHPRIHAAVEWVEDVSKQGSPRKVLVFGNYTAAMEALRDALNYRQFLRELGSGEPTKLPSTLRGRDASKDPNLQLICEQMKGCGELGSLDNLGAAIRRASKEYDTQSKGLHKQIERALPHAVVRREEVRQWLRLIGIEYVLGHFKSGPGPGLGDLRDYLHRLMERINSVTAAPSEDAKDDHSSSFELGEVLKDEDLRQGRRSDFGRLLTGQMKWRTRRILQALFNERLVRPTVLIAQARVASEGLNLQEACRHLLFLHMDWNPALIEQQIGRIDRVNSLWESEFDSSGEGSTPRIELCTVVLKGTSDAERRQRIKERTLMLDAHLFGELLSPDMAQLRPDWRERVEKAVPNFVPPRLSSTMASADQLRRTGQS